jgi:hypothetical protein
VLAALTVTHRAAGWNFRPADTIRFDLANGDGTACRLLVMPYRRWAARRIERLHECQRGGHAAECWPSEAARVIRSIRSRAGQGDGKMKLAMVVALAVLLGACGPNNDHAQIAELQKQVASLSEQVHTLRGNATASATLDLQRKCAMDAKRMFEASGWSLSKPVAGNTAAFYSHFNPTMQKCFMVFQFNALISPFAETWILSDANENVSYGTLVFEGDKVTTCDLTPTAETQHCASKQEFDKYLVRYMGTVPR